MNPKKVDFAVRRLLPPAFSLRALGVSGLKGSRGPGDDGPTAIDEEGGEMRAYVLRIRVSIGAVSARQD